MANSKRQSSDKKTVLIVEDEVALADIYTTALELGGFDVIVAEDGIKGLASAIENMPDLILLDIMLPGKDGFEVLKDLKLNPDTKHIPVVILSNLGQSYEVVRGKKLGAEKFLVKAELTPKSVLSEVKTILS